MIKCPNCGHEADPIIEKMLENFDFEKVQNVMRALDWRWRGEEPTVKQMIDCARNLLIEAQQKKCRIGIGGFEAHYDDHYDDGNIRLSFVVASIEEWDVAEE